MPRTNAEIDELNVLRRVSGEELLPYETEETDKKAEEDKAAEMAKQKEIDDAKKKEEDDKAEAEKLKLAAEKKETKVEEPELDDDKVIAYLKNKKGKEISSLEDLLNPKVEPTPEEKQKLIDQREADKISFGLTKGLFTKNELEQFITESKDPVSTVFAAYAANQKELDPTLTDDDIKEEFDNEFSLNAEKDSRSYKKGQTLLKNLATNIIREKHSKILNLETEYSAYENSTSKEREAETKIKTQLPIYTNTLQKIGKDLNKFSIPISDTENFETELEDADVKDIIEQMADPKYAQNQINKGFTEEGLKQIVDTAKILKNLPKILSKYADKVLLDNQAGLRGVRPDGKRGERNGLAVELTEDQKKAIGLMETLQIAN